MWRTLGASSSPCSDTFSSNGLITSPYAQCRVMRSAGLPGLVGARIGGRALRITPRIPVMRPGRGGPRVIGVGRMVALPALVDRGGLAPVTSGGRGQPICRPPIPGSEAIARHRVKLAFRFPSSDLTLQHTLAGCRLGPGT